MVAPAMSALTSDGLPTMRHWPVVTALVAGSTCWQVATVALASGIDRTTSSTATGGGVRSRWVSAALPAGGTARYTASAVARYFGFFTPAASSRFTSAFAVSDMPPAGTVPAAVSFSYTHPSGANLT